MSFTNNNNFAVKKQKWDLKSFLKARDLKFRVFNPFSANITRWSNTVKQFAGKLPTNCLSVFDHFVGLALKGLNSLIRKPLSK